MSDLTAHLVQTLSFLSKQTFQVTNSFNIITTQVTYSISVSHEKKSLFDKYYIVYKIPLKFLTTIEAV